MPPIELQARYEDAVLWPVVTTPPFTDDYGEDRVSATAVSLKVQWVWRRRESVDSFGNTVAIEAEAVVDREIEVGSKMWRGSLADWLGTGSGGDDDEVLTVVSHSEQKDIKGRVTRRTVQLGKFRDSLPERA